MGKDVRIKRRRVEPRCTAVFAFGGTGAQRSAPDFRAASARASPTGESKSRGFPLHLGRRRRPKKNFKNFDMDPFIPNPIAPLP